MCSGYDFARLEAMSKLPGETFHMEAMPPKRFFSSGSVASFQGWTGDSN
jgi:hypothetical protein